MNTSHAEIFHQECQTLREIKTMLNVVREVLVQNIPVEEKMSVENIKEFWDVST